MSASNHTRDFVITRMITEGIGLHSVLLPVLIKIYHSVNNMTHIYQFPLITIIIHYHSLRSH